jgi:hypothetical protein
LDMERAVGERGEVQWRTAGLSIYIGAEGEAAAGDYGGETTDDKWGRKWLDLRGV